MGTKASADAEREDVRSLLQVAAFRRFLFRIVETSGICASTYGAEDAILYREGRRSLGLDILRWVGDAHPMPEHPGVPVNALLTILGEESRRTPAAREARNESRYDRTSELNDDDEPRS